MRKEIKSYGNTNVLVLTADDLKVYELKTGDIVEIVVRKVNMEDDPPTFPVELSGDTNISKKIVK